MRLSRAVFQCEAFDAHLLAHTLASVSLVTTGRHLVFAITLPALCLKEVELETWDLRVHTGVHRTRFVCGTIQKRVSLQLYRGFLKICRSGFWILDSRFLILDYILTNVQ